MSEYPEAKLAFITNPDRRVAVLNMQIEGEELKRVFLSKAQLLALNHKCADILMKDFA